MRHTRTEVEQLHDLSVSITQNSKINVVIDNSLETAMTDYKNIYVTIQLIPEELRKYRRVVSRVLDGQVAHEAGHVVITPSIKQSVLTWISRQYNQQLANVVHQTLEDKRVNHFIYQRYRFDYAHRLWLLADVSNRLWVDTLKLQIAEQRNSRADLAMKPESHFLEKMLIPLSALKGVHGWEVEKDFNLTQEQKEFINKATKILDDARFDKMPMSVVHRCQELYDHWNTHITETKQKDGEGEDAQKNCPRSIGGKLKLQSGQATKKELAKIEKNLRKQEQEQEEEVRKGNKSKDDGKGKDDAFIGKGTGLNIPSPQPDEAEYENIAQRNREHIERLLNLLKKLAKPHVKIANWQKTGRFMSEVLTKAYLTSKRRSITDVYSSRTIRLEKAEACIGLIVDLSGSVNLRDAEDSLTTISEVCGRWLRDEDFAIIVFGSEFQKIKAYVEPYHTTRNRIGGMTCLGGTEMYEPLDELYKMTKAQTNSRTKLIIIVSDFYTNKDDKCKKLIKQIEKDNIGVIGLGIDSTTEQYVKTFCERAKYIGNIRELPEAVFDLYREVAF